MSCTKFPYNCKLAQCCARPNIMVPGKKGKLVPWIPSIVKLANGIQWCRISEYCYDKYTCSEYKGGPPDVLNSSEEFVKWVCDGGYIHPYGFKLRPFSDMLILKTPKVKGLHVYGAWGNYGKFYGAWCGRELVGWLFVQSAHHRGSLQSAKGRVGDGTLLNWGYEKLTLKPFKRWIDALRTWVKERIVERVKARK